ncbi:MAG: hypothetical protein QOH19_1885, partial [Actinomycetota bacterium]|nr:hypothetical protein [Actinomycetota bacterium]
MDLPPDDTGTSPSSDSSDDGL